jgi:hypothetical protein
VHFHHKQSFQELSIDGMIIVTSIIESDSKKVFNLMLTGLVICTPMSVGFIFSALQETQDNILRLLSLTQFILAGCCEHGTILASI